MLLQPRLLHRSATSSRAAVAQCTTYQHVPARQCRCIAMELMKVQCTMSRTSSSLRALRQHCHRAHIIVLHTQVCHTHRLCDTHTHTLCHTVRVARNPQRQEIPVDNKRASFLASSTLHTQQPNSRCSASAATFCRRCASSSRRGAPCCRSWATTWISCTVRRRPATPPRVRSPPTRSCLWWRLFAPTALSRHCPGCSCCAAVASLPPTRSSVSTAGLCLGFVAC